MFLKCFPLWITGLIMLLIGCASSRDESPTPDEFTNLVQIVTPEKESVQPSNIYIDSAKVIHPDDRTSILIMGSFPDGCTHIGAASHALTNGSVALTLEAWRDPEKICTQSLVSFSFIYNDFPESMLESDSVRINGHTYSLQK